MSRFSVLDTCKYMFVLKKVMSLFNEAVEMKHVPAIGEVQPCERRTGDIGVPLAQGTIPQQPKAKMITMVRTFSPLWLAVSYPCVRAGSRKLGYTPNEYLDSQPGLMRGET